MFAQPVDGQPISAGIGSSQQRAYETLSLSLNLGVTGHGVYTDGQPLDLDVEQAAFALPDPALDGEPLQFDIEQAALALPDPIIDGDSLQSDIERELEPYDPFADAPYDPGQEAYDLISDAPYDPGQEAYDPISDSPYDPGQEAYDPISDSPYDDFVATPGFGSNQQQAERAFVQEQNLGSTDPVEDDPRHER